VEERFRKRYLDILSNSQVKELFIKRARFWDVTREFFKKEGFLSKHLIIDVMEYGNYDEYKYGFEFPMEIVFSKDYGNTPSIEVGKIKANIMIMAPASE